MYDGFGVRLSLISALPAIAEAHGVPLHFLMSLGGLRDDTRLDGDGIATRGQVCAMMQGLARKSGDATIGFQMARATDPAMLGLSWACLRAGRTLREALLLQFQYMPWLQRGVLGRLDEGKLRACWTHRMIKSDPLEARFLNEGIAAFLVWTVRTISAQPDARLHVVLPHRPLVSLKHYEDALHCAVSFAPGPDLIVQFNSALLDCPNALLGGAATDLDPVATRQVPSDYALSDQDLLLALDRMFGAAALLGKLSLRASSTALGIAPRSLQRRLAEIGTTYEDVVDAWRRDQARAMLARPGARTDQVATCLGYGDASHFIRAFRRWEGVSPGQFRSEVGTAA